MAGGQPEESQATVGALFGRLKEDAQGLIRAEAAVYKAIARKRLTAARLGLVCLAVALFLLFAAFNALMLGIVMGLARWIGGFGAGVAVAVVAAAIAALLGRFGAQRLARLWKQEQP